ncbi:uncharacterized protein ASPWEDRAFT_44843 [Neofusicoccum parvum]|nr:uncharacterized protein ASPWEDRAFT_44843 [Neofusicoccum parvum]
MSERGSSESCRSRLSTSNSKFRSRDLWRRSANLSEQLSQETLKKLFSSDQSQKDKPCNFCERMIKDGGMEIPGAESQCSWLFHDDAPEGPNRRSDPDFSEWNQTTRNRHLCDFCSHLRLMRLRRLTRTKGPTFWIYLDDLDALRSRPDCVFCRLLVKIITRYSASLPDFQPVSRVKLCVDEFPEYKDGFLQIVDENDELITTLECQLDTEEVFPDKMYLERPTLRTRTIDWDKANLWLKRRNPPAVAGDRPADFRVIDVVDECVVAAPPECEYVTLSYVWGPWQPAKRTLKATKANIEELASPGFLKGKKIPATIADAMAVCSLIGKRYLWVDRFCIIQDDADSWRAQTDAMDKIYSNSYVTLVAMEGNDAHAGLRGVSGVRSYEVLFQGMKIWENCPSPPGGMSESTWSTRGWTLQEALLSQNLLIFTEKRVFFESLENLGIQMDTIPQSEIISSQMPSAKLLHWHISLTDSHRGLSYFNCLHEYSRRHLGNPMDILRAFTGILQYFFGNDHLSGIPVCEFSKALLWYPLVMDYCNDTAGASAL